MSDAQALSDAEARSGKPGAPRWHVLFTPRWLSWHLFAIVAFIGMWWLGDWQYRRALDGNALSWAYTFEWPVFAIFGAVFWVKTVRDELHPAEQVQSEGVLLPVGAGSGSVTADGILASQGTTGRSDSVSQAEPDDDDAPDVELDEYNAYLARLSREVKGHGKWHGLR